jgi:phosphoribosylformylglycinamidine synthase
MIVLRGTKAYSDFRIKALIQKIKGEKLGSGVDIKSVSSEFVYFLDIDDSEDKKEERKKFQDDGDIEDTIEKAKELLGAQDIFESKELDTCSFFVTPRKGTISPWSSKATDIFHNSGLGQIRRVERGIYFRLFTHAPAGHALKPLDSSSNIKTILHFFYDRMTEGVYNNIDDIFTKPEPAPLVQVDILKQGIKALEDANTGMGLALNKEEIDYLYDAYKSMDRNPSDVELLMFGQVNSEHCRHKIFNADWIIDGEKQPKSLFKMIQNTHEKNSKGTVLAYSDNSCVLDGFTDQYFEPQRVGDKTYSYKRRKIDIIAKVETHNHPTAISPFAGAATGVGGEIRDEGATGTGSKSKAGLNAFMVSNLRVPGFLMPWEKDYAQFPSRLATPFEIMIDGPIGGASFGNEFGRPQLCGIFKTYEEHYNGRYRGYHKPIMVAGGMGNIKSENVRKKDIEPESYIIQIGGPAMKIGIGGGAASSMDTGTNSEDLDFNSVQRGNAEMQRRAQEVIDSCISLGKDNPILSIHDVGAGGLSNACPELVSETGGDFWLRKIHSEDKSMSPMEIWCCEAQERYVLAVSPDSLDDFLELCKRERCPVAVIGQANNKGRLSLYDEYFDNKPINMDIGIILN